MDAYIFPCNGVHWILLSVNPVVTGAPPKRAAVNDAAQSAGVMNPDSKTTTFNKSA